MGDIADWPNWVWALLILQVAIVWALHRLEKGVESIGNLLFELQHPPDTD